MLRYGQKESEVHDTIHWLYSFLTIRAPAEAQLFERGAGGKVAVVVLHQGGRDRRGRRMTANH